MAPLDSSCMAEAAFSSLFVSHEAWQIDTYQSIHEVRQGLGYDPHHRNGFGGDGQEEFGPVLEAPTDCAIAGVTSPIMALLMMIEMEPIMTST